MASAGEKLKADLAQRKLHGPCVPVYANATAEAYGGDIAALLVRQVQSPVRWQATVEALIGSGVDTFFECGPGKTLCGLIKKISKDVQAYPVQDAESLQAALAAYRA